MPEYIELKFNIKNVDLRQQLKKIRRYFNSISSNNNDSLIISIILMTSYTYFGLAPLFQSKFHRYMLSLELISDQELVSYILAFLDLGDIIKFASSCQRFYAILKIPSVEIRLLRAKVEKLQNKKPIFKLNRHLNLSISYSQINSLDPLAQPKRNNFKTVTEEIISLNKKFRLFKYLKTNGLVKDEHTFNKLIDEKDFKNQFNKQVLEDTKTQKSQQMNQIKKQQEIKEFEKYRKYFQSQVDNSKKNSVNMPEIIIPVKRVNRDLEKQMKLKQIKYLQIREDYLRRKKLKLDAEFERKKMIQESRAEFGSIDEEQMKIIQRQNISKLYMQKAPALTEDLLLLNRLAKLERQTIKVLNSSILSNVFTKLKFFLGVE